VASSRVDEANCPESHGRGGRILNGKRYLIHDRDPLFTAEFMKMLADTGVQSVKLPPRSPNLNADAERFVRTIKESCLDRMIPFGEGSRRKDIHEFVEHIGNVTTGDWKTG
jgi:putative transposase